MKSKELGREYKNVMQDPDFLKWNKNLLIGSKSVETRSRLSDIGILLKKPDNLHLEVSKLQLADIVNYI